MSVFGGTASKLVYLGERNSNALAVIGPTPGRDTTEVTDVQSQHTPTPDNQQDQPERARQRWTEREDGLLRACVPAVSAERLAFILGRPINGVYHRLRALGLCLLDHPARFWQQVVKHPTDTNACWLWAGCISSGYGVYGLDGRTEGAHRVSYAMVHGPIAPNHHIHHRCEVKRCVNPTHLESLHIAEHALVGKTFAANKARQTHCIHGHEFTPENTYRWGKRRGCRTCMKARSLINGARKRQKA